MSLVPRWVYRVSYLASRRRRRVIWIGPDMARLGEVISVNTQISGAVYRRKCQSGLSCQKVYSEILRRSLD